MNRALGFEKTQIRTTPEQLAQQELDDFAINPGLVELGNLFGLRDLSETTKGKLLALQGLAGANWDFRNGAERQVVDWSNELFDQEGSEQWDTIFAAADKLGLVQNTEPRNKTPNSLVILGGANHAPLDRLKYGLSVVDDFDQLVYLGADRPVSNVERIKSADYAKEPQTEFDLGCAAFETIPGIRKVETASEVVAGENGRIRLYEFEKDGETKHAWVLSTPRMAGSHRATTHDNYDFFAKLAGLEDDPQHTVVAVTTGYTKGQHFSAVQELTLPYGVHVETVGHSAEYAGVKRKPTQLLQETKAALDAAVRLEQAIEKF